MNTTTQIIQKIILLQTGAPANNAALGETLSLFDQTKDWSLVAESVDAFMTQRLLANEKGINGVIQAIADNGFGLKLTDLETEQLITNLITQGIDSWSKLFAFLIVEIDGELNALLDNRAEAAEQFTNVLSELNKDQDYDGSQAINAAREWIAGIGSADESLTAASNVIQNLINSFINGNVQGKVLDGFIAGATVFIDENGDRLLNSNEISTTTDDQGNFLFEGDIPAGPLISIGGTDIGTGQPFTGTLSAPSGATTISPITTLVNQLLINGQAADAVAAEQILFESLGIPQVDLSSFDPITISQNPASTLTQQSIALQLQSVTAQITNLLNIATALLGDDTEQSVTDSLLQVLISAQQNNQPVNLANIQVLVDIIATTTTQNSAISEDTITQMATILSEVNNKTQLTIADSNASSQDTLSDIFNIQTVIQAQITPAIDNAATDNDFADIFLQFTGSNLTDKINSVSTVTPEIPPAPPVTTPPVVAPPTTIVDPEIRTLI